MIRVLSSWKAQLFSITISCFKLGSFSCLMISWCLFKTSLRLFPSKNKIYFLIKNCERDFFPLLQIAFLIHIYTCCTLHYLLMVISCLLHETSNTETTDQFYFMLIIHLHFLNKQECSLLECWTYCFYLLPLIEIWISFIIFQNRNFLKVISLVLKSSILSCVWAKVTITMLSHWTRRSLFFKADDKCFAFLENILYKFVQFRLWLIWQKYIKVSS